MLRIAICDDMVVELQRIAELTNEYLTRRGMTADVRLFSHPDMLLSVCETETFHIFLLDMVMPFVSGLELGRSIRRTSTDAQIIYITTEPSYALDAYSVNPLHYLLKPIDKEAFFAALDLATEKMNYKEALAITVKTKEGLRTLSADSIVCSEYARHSVVYTLAGGEQIKTSSIHESFSKHVAPLLHDRRFIQPHAAFVVNMSFAERLNKDGFTLQGGIFAPVSGRQFAAVRNTYLNYRLGGPDVVAK